MDRRIAVCIIAGLLLLVVTAAYAPNPGELIEKPGKSEVKEDPMKQLLQNQAEMLKRLEVLEQNQATMMKDLKYIRSKSH